ncbi:MAG: glycosyltransferase family 9 protein [Deltaproteobacteria bacterium]
MEILIIKLSAIGDVVHSLPFLEVLKENFPYAQIDWVVEDPADDIVRGHPKIRRVLVSPRRSLVERFSKDKEWRPLALEIKGFLNRLRSREYDLVIDLQGLLKSGVLAGVSRGKRKVGMSGSREGAQLFLNEPPVWVNYDLHAIDRYLQMARYLGCHWDRWEGRIPVFEADRQAMDLKLAPHGLDGKPLVAINPMAKWPTKLWEVERFASLADRIASELSCEVIFTGSKEDRSTVAGITGVMKGAAHNFAGEINLKELAVLYEKCRLLVTTDTGPMHMAAAMGCPVVALFGPTAPWRTGPYGEGHQIVREPMVCSPCFKRRCTHKTCMREISADRVFESVRTIFYETVPNKAQQKRGENHGHKQGIVGYTRMPQV